MSFLKLSVHGVERRVKGFGKRNVGGIVSREILPQRPDAVHKRGVLMTFNWETLKLVGNVCDPLWREFAS